jgi:hypothetical protein
MAGLSKYLALGLFNATLNPVRESLVPPLGLHVALHTAAPSDATYGTEASYGAYARQALNSLTAEVGAETATGNVDIVVTNGSALVFPASTGPSGQTITHWAIWDSAIRGDGNILYSGSLGASRFIVTGDSVVVPEGNLVLTIK